VSSPVTGRVAPRDDLRELAGYHSPQLDVAIRLNTNESPFAPPPAFVDGWLTALGGLDFNRYPDRAAADLRAALGEHLGQPVERLFCANGSNEVLQTLLLTYGGHGRSALVFEPTYALHSHISRITGTGVVEAERLPGFHIDPDEAAALVRRRTPSIVFVCSPNNPTGTVEARDTVEAIATAAAAVGALVVVDEAYGEFSHWSAMDLVDEARPLVVVRTYSKVWSMAALRLGFAVAPTWVIDELEKVVLPYSLSAPTQLAGVLALGHRDEMARRVEALVAERERVTAALEPLERVTVYPSGANFVLTHIDGDGHAVWEALLDGRGDVDVATGIPFFDHMLSQLGKHGGLDLTVRATGDLDVDLHHTVEDVGIVLGTAVKEALGDKAGVRRFANSLVPLDEALVEVALDLSGRPYLVYDVDPVSEWIGTFDPQLAEEFWKGFVDGARLTLHVRGRSGKNGHHIIEASFKGVARALRDAVRVEGTGVPSTKGTL
jgi:histidinol-phosphate aminotransferase